MTRLLIVFVISALFACKATQVSTTEDPTKGLGDNPYYELDGQPATKESLKNIDPQQIASVTVINKKSGRKLFGKMAKDGAVIFETEGHANRLYNYVDSLITKVLNYEYNEYSYLQPIVIDTTLTKRIHSSHSTFPKNPEPPILLDGEVVTKESLKETSIELIDKIELLKPGEQSDALFGTMGKHGAIILTSKAVMNRKKNDK